MFFEYLKAVFYGVLEGITEWLPVSSTGHLILLDRVLPLRLDAIFGTEFANHFLPMFDVVIQFGAILAVICLYFKKLNPMSKDPLQRKNTLKLWTRLIVATLPAAIIGIFADRLCKHFLNYDIDSLLFKPEIVAAALIVYGILFIVVERLAKRPEDNSTQLPSLRAALAIGFFQALAIIPGTSRSGATILGARILGISRSSAAEFSFFAAIPVICGASIFKLADFGAYLAQTSTAMPLEAILILFIAFVLAFLVSTATIKFLTDFVKKHSFAPFGIYRVILGLLVLFTLNKA